MQEESLLGISMLFSIVLFLKIGHSADALSTAGGNVKKSNFKRVTSSSLQCNDTAAKSGFNYKCAKDEGGRKSVSMTLSPSITATLLTLLTFFGVCSHSTGQSHS